MCLVDKCDDALVCSSLIKLPLLSVLLVHSLRGWDPYSRRHNLTLLTIRHLDCPSLRELSIEDCSGQHLRSWKDYKGCLSLDGQDSQAKNSCPSLVGPSLCGLEQSCCSSVQLLLAWAGRFAFGERLLDAMLNGETSVKVQVVITLKCFHIAVHSWMGKMVSEVCSLLVCFQPLINAFVHLWPCTYLYIYLHLRPCVYMQPHWSQFTHHRLEEDILHLLIACDVFWFSRLDATTENKKPTSQLTWTIV